MNLKTKAKYLFLYLVLTAIGVLLAFRYWWTDPLILSGLNKFTIVLLFSVGICWLGILFLSIMIIRLLIVKIDNHKFISPLDLTNNKYYASEIGLKKAKIFGNAIAFIGFPMLFLTIFLFRFLIGIYETHELATNGVIENIVIKKLNKDIKKNSYAFIEYGKGKHSVNIQSDYLRLNDTIKIIYSNRNPNIVKFFNEYKENE
ncbi:hypothetical protein [Flavobacterium hydrophilum]|uniref:Uncharacterized protein n=1 Tax=Flavobacterium hydrophilum TaxID=2211445 RepID=A0A2V4C1B9_9FLAO|nr:hypothetical protein [Flavobacterium hydrophilum]PXY44935.1 hypothetical protein DMB68_09455 [Flavobacterium hydrophilum]